jgi:hypothetical protein
MRLPALLMPALLLASAAAIPAGVGCSTYRSDLDRARAHYDANEYEPALALFRVLEHDIDSFDAAEHAKYAYSRGMTDYRLAGLATSGNSVADPKQAFRSHARHWLAVARAVEKETPGGLTQEESQRLEDALTDLNHDVYGGGDDVDGGAPKPAKPAEKTDR